MALTFSGIKKAGIEGSESEAITQLREVFDKKFEPAQDQFVLKYLSVATAKPQIAPGVAAELPISRDLVGLLLAELYQEKGQIEQAITIVEQLEPSTFAAVSLADLYTQANRDKEVVELTNSVANEDEASTLLLIYRGIALGRQGHNEAALQAFKEALRFRARPVEMRHLALFERARVLQQAGKSSLAKKDLERIMAEDATYPGLREMLEA